MTQSITKMSEAETLLVSGGVTMRPDTKGCTNPRGKKKPIFATEQGGPLAVKLAVVT